MSIILFIVKELFNFKYQPQEEAGSAEEQPASNKADTYTVNKERSAMAAFFFIMPVSHNS
jgi:hypothetical protein